jgi:superfamily II DNA/RNA helicase
MRSEVDVILITTAGSESLNLQAAEHFVFLDLPFSYGDYYQLIGRMIRIGSSHSTVVAHHLIGVRRSGEKTIDRHVLSILRSKKKLIDKVAGDGIIGGLHFKSGDDMVKDLLGEIKRSRTPVVQSHAPKTKKLASSVKRKVEGSKHAVKGPKETTVEEPILSVVIDLDF